MVLGGRKEIHSDPVLLFFYCSKKKPEIQDVCECVFAVAVITCTIPSFEQYKFLGIEV